MMTSKEIGDVVYAYLNGASIQYRPVGSNSSEWLDCIPAWNFRACDYRVKPTEPKESGEPREFWLNVYDEECRLCAHRSKEGADQMASDDRIECIKVREVL